MRECGVCELAHFSSRFVWNNKRLTLRDTLITSVCFHIYFRERTKEEDKEFREWYYKEFGMGSPHSPNVPDPFWFLTGKQAILLAVTLGFCLQYARWR